MSSRVEFHNEPTSRSRVRVHDQPGVSPGSRHTRVEVGTEGQVIQRHDGMKTRITMGAAAPSQQASPANVQVRGGSDPMNTRVQIHGPPAAVPVVGQVLEQHKTPAEVVAELELRVEADELAVARAEKRLDQTHDELAKAKDELEQYEAAQAELAAEAKRKTDEAIAEAVADERAKLEADEAAAERAKLEAERAKLDGRRAKLEAAKQKKQLDEERALLEEEKRALDGEWSDLEKAEAAAETEPGDPPNVEVVIGDEGVAEAAAPSSTDSDDPTDAPPPEDG